MLHSEKAILEDALRIYEANPAHGTHDIQEAIPFDSEDPIVVALAGMLDAICSDEGMAVLGHVQACRVWLAATYTYEGELA
jgi:hypothetical protein